MKNNRLKKLFAVVATVVTMASVTQIGTSAAWKQDSKGWWNTEGRSYSTGWRAINGSWYYFGSDGYMKTGWAKDNGTWYYLQPSGAMKTGWVKDNGSWYYLQSSGAMKAGWVKDNGDWYYLQPSGAMKTGWAYDNGTWYYLQPSGEMKKGWVKDNGTWYYLQPSGAMKTGWAYDNGTWYYLQSTGAMKTGWVYDKGTWYFTDESGAMKTGVIEVDGKVYSFATTGAMQTGEVTINGVNYVFDKSGAAIGTKKPTPGSSYTNTGKPTQKTFQEIIDSKYNPDTQITLNDYETDGVIKPILNFTPGTETITIEGQEVIVTKDIYVTLNGKDAYIEGNLENGYTVTGTGTVEIRTSISVVNTTTGKLYYVAANPITIEK